MLSALTAAPFGYLWTVLGAIALGATVLGLDAFRSWWPMVEVGEGGLERWIVYRWCCGWSPSAAT